MPDYAMFTAYVAVEDQDEIAQDSSCMLAHSQGKFCRVVHFRINTTAPAVGLSRVPQKRQKPRYISYGSYHMLVSCCTNPTTTRTVSYTHLTLPTNREV